MDCKDFEIDDEKIQAKACPPEKSCLTTKNCHTIVVAEHDKPKAENVTLPTKSIADTCEPSTEKTKCDSKALFSLIGPMFSLSLSVIIQIFFLSGGKSKLEWVGGKNNATPKQLLEWMAQSSVVSRSVWTSLMQLVYSKLPFASWQQMVEELKKSELYTIGTLVPGRLYGSTWDTKSATEDEMKSEWFDPAVQLVSGQSWSSVSDLYDRFSKIIPNDLVDEFNRLSLPELVEWTQSLDEMADAAALFELNAKFGTVENLTLRNAKKILSARARFLYKIQLARSLLDFSGVDKLSIATVIQKLE